MDSESLNECSSEEVSELRKFSFSNLLLNSSCCSLGKNGAVHAKLGCPAKILDGVMLKGILVFVIKIYAYMKPKDNFNEASYSAQI